MQRRSGMECSARLGDQRGPIHANVIARAVKINSAVASTPWRRHSPSVVQGMQQRNLGSLGSNRRITLELAA